MKADVAKAALRAAHNAPASLAKAMEMNDAAMGRRRGRMMLPAPQVRFRVLGWRGSRACPYHLPGSPCTCNLPIQWAGSGCPAAG